MTTPADRAKALLAKFGPGDGGYYDKGYYVDRTNVGDLRIIITALGHDKPALDVRAYDLSDDFKIVLTLGHVADDDLVASIIRQVIDQHNGKQVV